MEVAVMSLSAHEQHALDTIEDDLAGSDPKLASMLATFSRLAAGEEMPVREKTRAGRPRATGCQQRRRRARRHAGITRSAWRRPVGPWASALLFLVVAVAVVVTVVVALVVSHGGNRACTDTFALVCTGQARGRTSRPAEHKAAPAQVAKQASLIP
jgi:hypothetical protein